jgi:hypothetical protein
MRTSKFVKAWERHTIYLRQRTEQNANYKEDAELWVMTCQLVSFQHCQLLGTRYIASSPKWQVFFVISYADTDKIFYSEPLCTSTKGHSSAYG